MANGSNDYTLDQLFSVDEKKQRFKKYLPAFGRQDIVSLSDLTEMREASRKAVYKIVECSVSCEDYLEDCIVNPPELGTVSKGDGKGKAPIKKKRTQILPDAANTVIKKDFVIQKTYKTTEKGHPIITLTDPNTNKIYVGKVFLNEDGNFQNEVEMLRHMHDCSFVVDMLGVKTYNVGDDVYQMILLEEGDQTLQDKMDKKKLDPSDAQMFIRKAIQILAALETYGIVHCDIKPKNLLIVNGTDLKVFDMDGARMVGQEMPVEVSISYCPPERAQGETKASHSVDIWSGGMTIVQMLLNLIPGALVGSEEEIRQILQNGTEIHTLLHDLGINLDSVIPPSAKHLVEDMLKLEPTHRLSAHALLDQRSYLKIGGTNTHTPVTASQVAELNAQVGKIQVTTKVTQKTVNLAHKQVKNMASSTVSVPQADSKPDVKPTPTPTPTQTKKDVKETPSISAGKEPEVNGKVKKMISKTWPPIFLKMIAKGYACPDVIVLPDGGLAAVDQTNSLIHIFAAAGVEVRTIGSKGSGNGELHWPYGIAVLDDQLVVADTFNHRISIFCLSDGHWMRSFGSEGSAKGELKWPASVAILPPLNDIVISDKNNCRIQCFSQEGKVKWAVGSQGDGDEQFYNQDGLAVTADRHILVCDEGNKRIQVLGFDGTFLSRFKTEGNPYGVTLSPDGLIAVTMHNPHQIGFYRENGELLRKFGSEGSEPGQFNMPCGICFDSEGQLIVGEWSGFRIRQFRLF